jgi:hypothetical protein
MRNPRWFECYENSFTTGGSYWCGIFNRSSNGMVFNNTMSGYSSYWMRFDSETICRTAPGYGQPCQAVWETANRDVYPCQDQIGAGIDTGWGTAQSSTEAKLHIFNNTHNGSITAATHTTCTQSATMVQADRDFWQHNTNFLADPTTGIGVGTLAQRPTSGLTTGVKYWATDAYVLYVATGATTWATYYTPYTYPHPLQSA